MSTISPTTRTYLLIFGIIQLAGAWWLLGAGIYSSPLAIRQPWHPCAGER